MQCNAVVVFDPGKDIIFKSVLGYCAILIIFFSDFRGVITRAGPVRPRMRATADAVVIEPEDVCKMPPVTPHERACLAFMPKWTFDFR